MSKSTGGKLLKALRGKKTGAASPPSATCVDACGECWNTGCEHHDPEGPEACCSTCCEGDDDSGAVCLEECGFDRATKQMGRTINHLTREQFKILQSLELSYMKPKSDPYLQVLDELRDLTMKKRAGYSPGADPFANFRKSQMFGVSPLTGILVRVTDKLSRIASLLSNPANDQVGESLRETLLDAGNYLLIAVAMMDGDKVVESFGDIEAFGEHETGD